MVKTGMKRAVVFELLLSVLPMLICAALLTPIIIYIEGDVFRQNEYEIITTVNEFISVAAFFAAIGTIIYAVFMLNRKACIVTTAILAAATICSSALTIVWQVLISSSTGFSHEYYIFVALANFAIDAVTVAAIIFITLLLRRRARSAGNTLPSANGKFFSRTNPLNVAGLSAAALVFVITVITSIIETVSLVSEYGWPVNLTEIIYIITPYLDAIIFFAIGYTMTALASLVLNRE